VTTNRKAAAARAIGIGVVEQLQGLQRLSSRLSSNRADAEDLAQDACVNALRGAARFTPGSNLGAWLRTIVRNLASNRRRDQARARVRADERHVAAAAATRRAPGASPEEALLGRTADLRLRTALESMPKGLRDAVWLRDVEDLTYAEIADRLCIPKGTVMSRISRGRRLLHDRLLALGEEHT
jgi:RNA polymerase sigma-70 factor (ECF subfamily)